MFWTRKRIQEMASEEAFIEGLKLLVLEPCGFESRVQMHVELAQDTVAAIDEFMWFAGSDDEDVTSASQLLLTTDGPF